MLFSGGIGTLATVEGKNIVMRMRDRADAPPLFSVKEFHTTIDLGTLRDSSRHISVVTITGLDITIPPKGHRPDLTPDENQDHYHQEDSGKKPQFIIDRLEIKTAALVDHARG